MAKIITIGLEGGDVAGKSDAGTFLRKKLEARGVEFIFIPEVATRVITRDKLHMRELREQDPDRYFEAQLMILATMMRDEAAARAEAEKLGGPDTLVVIATDRTCPGVQTYTTKAEFTRMLDLLGTNWMEIRDTRYDAIIHMVTAANGATEAYLKNVGRNPARYKCPPEVAIDFDCRAQMACLGHPHLRVVDNSTGFDEKLERVWRHVEKIIDPNPVETERRFWIYERPRMNQFPVVFQPIEIEQVYLKDSPGHRVRTRSQRGEGALHYETRKTLTASLASSGEDERLIEQAEYRSLLSQADLARSPIQKRRHHFLYKSQYFELDFFNEPKETRALTILEIELLDENDPVEIPPWLGEYIEVTHDHRFKNSNLCKKSTAP